MSTIFEGRRSDSPYIDMIWRGHIGPNYAPVCPADVRWNLLFTKYQGQVNVSVEGATTQYVPKTQPEGMEFLVIKFELGVYLPYIPAGTLVNTDAHLPNGASQKFWLNGSTWQFPDFENVETFVGQLLRAGTLVQEPVVNAVLHNEEPYVSTRTVRRRFLHTTGLTPKTITQIERAQQAVALLEQGVSILDTVYQVGYADQPHLTRSLRRFYGDTPANIAQLKQV